MVNLQLIVAFNSSRVRGRERRAEAGYDWNDHCAIHLTLSYICVFLVLFLFLLLKCQGTGMIEVHFLSYANPRQNDHQNRCCSGQEVQGRCSSPCRTLFTVCVGFLHNIQGCYLGRKSSGILGNSSFVIPSNSLLQIPWRAIQSWPVRINLSSYGTIPLEGTY